MAVMHVRSCDFSPVHNKYILFVDVLYSNEENKDPHTYLVLATKQDIQTRDKMQQFVEQEIISQQITSPDWTGTEWRTTRV